MVYHGWDCTEFRCTVVMHGIPRCTTSVPYLGRPKPTRLYQTGKSVRSVKSVRRRTAAVVHGGSDSSGRGELVLHATYGRFSSDRRTE